MKGSRTSFLRVAAVCAVVSALTTLPIHLLDFPGNTFEERLALRDNPLYLARFAIIAVHVCLVVVSMLGVALVRRRAAPALTTLGFLGYVLFASVELLRQSLAFFALNRSWRAAYAAPGADDATRAQMETLLAAWPGINDALFHLFIFGFTAGTACYAAALLNGRGLQRATGAVFAAWAAMDAVGFLSGIVPRMPELPALLSTTVQPLGRVLVGVWLWRSALTAAEGFATSPSASAM
jgi:hypothetical protein